VKQVPKYKDLLLWLSLQMEGPHVM
jgi:hypothetical protein